MLQSPAAVEARLCILGGIVHCMIALCGGIAGLYTVYAGSDTLSLVAPLSPMQHIVYRYAALICTFT
jgi:hypothetical protein